MDKVAKGMTRSGREAAGGPQTEGLAQRIRNTLAAFAAGIRNFFKGTSRPAQGFPR